jgi:hypothetical protein
MSTRVNQRIAYVPMSGMALKSEPMLMLAREERVRMCGEELGVGSS